MTLAEAMAYLRPFVFAWKTTCFVDQNSLLWILKQVRLNKFLKYRIRLEEYEYEIKYVKERETDLTGIPDTADALKVTNPQV